VLAGAAFAAIAGLSQTAVAAKAKYRTWGYDATSMDPSVKPGDDFFKYVNGGWDKRTQIAPDRTSAGDDEGLTDEAERDVHKIVEDLAKDPKAAGAGGQRVGDLYAAWMDEKGLEARGTAPLKPYLAKIGAVKSKAEVALFAGPGFAAS
jgi:putative endopeptidase